MSESRALWPPQQSLCTAHHQLFLRSAFPSMKIMRSCISILASLWLATLLEVTQCQIFMMKNAQLEKCIHAADDTGRVSLAKCKVNSHHQYWSWDPRTHSIINLKSKSCLTVVKPRDQPTLRVEACEGKKNQAWHCDPAGHLSIHGHSLYLSAKQGTKKVMLTRGSDKFSRWKTLMDSPICGEMATNIPTTGLSSAPNTENATEISHADEHRNSTEVLETAQILLKVMATSQRPEEAETMEGTRYDEVHFNSTWERIYVFEENSPGWKTAMLILSPLTFLLGAAIVAINVRDNRKRKLSALSSPSKAHHKLGTPFEKSPLTSGDVAHPGANYAGAPTLRHGEILIEWKDGTITPLYDQP